MMNKLLIEKQIDYIKALIDYYDKTHFSDQNPNITKYYDKTDFGDWDIDFMKCMIKIKTDMALKYPDAHDFANKYVNQKNVK